MGAGMVAFAIIVSTGIVFAIALGWYYLVYEMFLLGIRSNSWATLVYVIVGLVMTSVMISLTILAFMAISMLLFGMIALYD